MRDPAGRLDLSGPAAIRHLSGDTPLPTFLTHPVARALVEDGLLVPFRIEAADRIESPKYSFVSQPGEWADAQFHDAALLTLSLAERILDAGFELKDASAWNVVFDGCKPRFCDHLSFEPITRREWWAFGQFCRHFVFPLAVSRWRGLRASQLFLTFRDGLPAPVARELLGTRGLLSRLLPLLWNANRASGASQMDAGQASPAVSPLHRSVVSYARNALFRPATSNPADGPGWRDYTRTRNHYAVEASAFKATQVDRWLSEMHPDRVLDLGCNTGEFSKLALRHAQQVIAIDADHDSVQRLYLENRQEIRLHVLVANLGDVNGGRGWAGAEFPGLLQRLRGHCDALLMLALTHHLHFSEGIPLAEIAALAAELTSRHLILEVIDEDDEMVKRLAGQRQRSTATFSTQQQRDAFARYFDLLDTVSLPQTPRQLLLMRRKP